MDLEELLKPFGPDELSWRIGSKSRDGKRGLALAYIDARDVMTRLDKAVGPENWQDEYSFHGEVIVCRLGLRIGIEEHDDGWVWKTDGAGKTQIEAEKGGISDAFKRAAVKWGIGRHLYGIESPWVPIEDYGRTKRITADAQAWLRSGAWDTPLVDQGKDKSKKPEKPKAAAPASDGKISDKQRKLLYASSQNRADFLGGSEYGIGGSDIIDAMKAVLKEKRDLDSLNDLPASGMDWAMEFIEAWEPGVKDGDS